VTAERGPTGVPAPALVTHVRLVSAVGLHVSPQHVRQDEQLGAHWALVLWLAANAVLPQVTTQRVLPEKFLPADVTCVAQLLGVNAHVDVQMRHAAEPISALGADILFLCCVDAHVYSERIGRGIEASTVNTLV